MEMRARYIVVGLFALLGLTAIAIFAAWTQSGQSFSARRNILVEFRGSTPGLQVGSPVAFNGLRVGEVTRLSFDPHDSSVVDALLSIAPSAPVTATTKIALQSEGLIGSTYVALSGGETSTPLKTPPGAAYPTLAAAGSATLTQQAQTTLNQLNKVLGENAQPLHETIANIQNFSAVLSRNSAKVDDILSGLARLAGGASAKPAPTPTYDLKTPVAAASPSPSSVQLVVADPTAVVAMDTQHFLSKAPDGRLTIETSQWADSIPKIVQKKLVAALEADDLRFASPPTDGLTPDFQLLVDIRAFQIEQGDPMTAQVRFNVRLQDQDGKIVAAAPVDGEAPAAALDGAPAAAAIDVAFATATQKLTAWALQAIAKHPASERPPQSKGNEAPRKAPTGGHLAPPPPPAPAR